MKTVKASGDVQEWMHSQGWSDGLPLVPPTPERVDAMLQATTRARSELIGQVPPMYGVATVERVAACAVMAGCDPSCFRVLIAATTSMLADAFNLHGVSATTSGATPVVVVSGRRACESAGLNSAHGALGSGSRANGTVGRALKLVLQHIGGARLGTTEATTLGSPCKWGLCVAEASDQLRGWEPFRAPTAPADADETVSVMSVTSGPTQLFDLKTKSALGLCEQLASLMAQACPPLPPSSYGHGVRVSTFP